MGQSTDGILFYGVHFPEDCEQFEGREDEDGDVLLNFCVVDLLEGLRCIDFINDSGEEG